jgi:DNA-binding transcriptional ArsR family regulator
MNRENNGVEVEEERAASPVELDVLDQSHACADQPGERAGFALARCSERVQITERAVQRIVSDLEEAGILTRIRDGRRNRYEVHADKPLRHPVESHRTVQDLLAMVQQDEE